MDVVEVEYIVSFGVGSITVTLLVLAIYLSVFACCGKPRPSFQFRVLAGPALQTVVVWRAGNFCSIYAIVYLGMSLGWPLVQYQLILSSLWATVYYKEISKILPSIIQCQKSQGFMFSDHPFSKLRSNDSNFVFIYLISSELCHLHKTDPFGFTKSRMYNGSSELQ